jgi:hypothetical protein
MRDIATQRISTDEGAYFKGRVNIQKGSPRSKYWVRLLSSK